MMIEDIIKLPKFVLKNDNNEIPAKNKILNYLNKF